MTEIYQRKGLVWPGWGWLVVAFLVLGIVWMVFAFSPDSSGMAARTRGPGQTAGPPVTVPVRSVEAIIQSQRRDVLIGHPVQMSNVTVESMAGGKGFWIGPGPNERVLAVLMLAPTGDQPDVPERWGIRPGVTTDITGTIGRFPGLERARAEWGLTPEAAEALRNELIFVRVERIVVTP